MKKWIITLILIMVSCQVVLATQCQVSEDNSTYVGITSAIYGGYIDEVSGVAHIQNLEENTLYYVRCRENITSSWLYKTQRTDTGWRESRMIAITLIMLGLVVFLFTLAYKGIEILRPAFFLLAFLFMLVALRVTTELASFYDISPNVISIMNYSFYILGLMYFVMVVYMLWNYTTMATKFKKQGEGYSEEMK